MADILKISTPLVDKVPIQPNKQVADPSIPFNLSDISKVIQTNQQSELLKQNNGMIEKEASPNILMNMLKDPSVTVGFLRNIFMLQEIIKLLPVNNSTFTREIQMLFDRLLVRPEDIVAELMRQENSSTAFKGALFDFLRDLLTTTARPEMDLGVANLLKSLNGMLSKRSILNSLSNSLLFLSDNVQSSQTLSSRLRALAGQFLAPNAPEQFQKLKADVQALLREVESSILFTPKLEKTVPLITYNLSRFSDNPDFLQEATTSLLTLIDGEPKKQKLTSLLYQFLTGSEGDPPENSRVMDILAEIIGRQAQSARVQMLPQQLPEGAQLREDGKGYFMPDGRFVPFETGDKMQQQKVIFELAQGKSITAEEMHLLDSEKIDKIVHSLLSSPCNYTPLLHFIVPVQDQDMRSFAEIWIDPNNEEENTGSGRDRYADIHMLIVFDVEGIGRFEAELFVDRKDITLNLLCPPAYSEAFSQIGGDIARAAAGSGYRFKEVVIGRLERSRSLMDVFKNLPHRRTGIDVKV